MPSLYQFTTPVGDVASGDFTTLYNASGLTVPNAGAGSVSGNLNVGGSLTVQGSSLLIGAVTLQSTLCLPNYCFPSPDGTTDQVLATDGSGNLYWADVTSLPGASYTIQADTATGGADLSLVSSSTTDSVKFAGGANITVTRTDASTITISTSASSIPNGTAQGQVLVWDGTQWTADNEVISQAPTSSRFTTTFKNNNTTNGGALIVRRDYDSHAYVAGDRATTVYQIASNSQAATGIGVIGIEYDAANPAFVVQTTTDNFTTRTLVTKIDSQDVAFNGTELILNANGTSSAAVDAQLTVERGTTGTDAYVKWNETLDRWELSNEVYTTGVYKQDGDSLYINADNSAIDSNVYFNSTRKITWDNTNTRFDIGGDIATAYENLYLNTDSTAVDSNVYFKGTAEYIRWNNTDSKFEFSDSIYVSTSNEPPAQFERRVNAVDVSQGETKTGLRLTERVVDAASNATDDGGTNLLFSRTSGSSGGTEVLYAIVGSRYYGTTNTADIVFQWSDDNFFESSPGVFPGTYTLLRTGAVDAEFFNDSLFIDYTTLGAAQVGINTATPAYTLDVNGDANVSGDIYISGVHVDLSTPVAQGQLLFVSDDSPATITNGSTINWTSGANRPNFQAETGIYGRPQSGLAVSTDTLSNNINTGDGSGVIIGVTDTASASLTNIASYTGIYESGGNHQIRMSTSTNNFIFDRATSITGGNTLNFTAAHGFSAGDRINYSGPSTNGLTFNTNYYVLATGLTSTQCQVSLTQGGTAVVLTNGTGLNLYFLADSYKLLELDQNHADIYSSNLTLNAQNTGIAATDAFFYVERGSTGADVAMKWNESTDRWQFTNNGSTFYNMVINLDDLNDVVITTATKGDMLYYDGSNWVNDNKIQADTSAQRAIFQYNDNSVGQDSALFVRKNYTTPNAFTNGDGTGIGLQLSNDNGAPTTYAVFGGLYDSALPSFRLRTSTDSFVSNNVLVASIDSQDVAFNGTEIILNANGTGSAAVDAQITVERGTTGADAYLRWNETPDRWEFTDNLFVTGTVSLDGDSLTINADNTSANSYLYFNNTENLKWDPAAGRFEFSDDLHVTGTVSLDGDSLTINADNTNTTSYLYFNTTENLRWNPTAGTGGRFELSDELYIDGVTTVNGDLYTASGGDLYLDGDKITLNDGNAAASSSIVFYTGGTDPEIKWNNSTTQFEFNKQVYITGGNDLYVDGDKIQVNAANAAASSYLYFNNTEYLAWDNSNQYFSLTDDLAVSGGISADSVTVDTRASLDTSTVSTSSITTVTVNETARNTMSGQVYITDGTDVHSVLFSATRNGGTALLTTFAEMYSTSALATFTADISGGNLRLRATTTTASALTFTASRISLT